MSFDKQVSAIIIKYLQGKELTDEESEQLNSFLNESSINKQLFDDLTNKRTLETDAQQLKEAREIIWDQITNHNEYYTAAPLRPRTIKIKAIAIAATAILVAGGVYFLAGRYSPKTAGTNNTTVIALTPEDIQPANDKTTLTLADGRTVILDPSAEGTVAREQGGSIVKLQNGELVYQSASDHSNLSTIYNTVTTSKGGKQRIVLSDGTIVWLNATSSIKYPVSFASAERKVFITGEAYFEVTRYTPFKGGERVPFIVSLPDGNEVEVLGTHFNINSYADENNIRVTLLEGKVRVSMVNGEWSMLKPGQQASITTNHKLQTTNQVDIDQVMAWKNGLFNFKNADIETILREAARWYDIDVVYKGKPADRFGGKISRQVSLGQLLMILRESNVSFEFEEGRKLIIYDN